MSRTLTAPKASQPTPAKVESAREGAVKVVAVRAVAEAVDTTDVADAAAIATAAAAVEDTEGHSHQTGRQEETRVSSRCLTFLQASKFDLELNKPRCFT